MNEVAVRMICEYIHDIDPDRKKNNKKPFTKLDATAYEEYCIMEWTACEILEAVMDKPDTPAVITVENFMIKMEMFYYMSERPDNKIRYEIARDTADDIGTMLI